MRISRYGLAVAALLASATIVAGPAAAQPTVSDCQTKILDQSSAHVLDQPVVDSAVRRLNNYGADTYVRVFQTPPSGGLETWWRTTYKSCGNWLSTDGVTPKPNVVVLMLVVGQSASSRSGIAYGSSYHSLDSKVNGIRTAMLNAADSRRASDGVVSAMDQIGAIINPNKLPTPPETDRTSAAKVIVIGLGIFFGVILLLVGSFFGGRALVRLRNDRRTQKAEWLEAKNAANVASRAAADQVNRAPSSEELGLNFAMKVEGLPSANVHPLRSQFDQIHDRVVELSSQFNDPMAPSLDAKLSTVQYRKEADRFNKIAVGLKQALGDFEQLLKGMDQLHDDLSPEGRKDRLDRLDDKLKGFGVNLEELGARFDVAKELRILAVLRQDAISARVGLGTQDGVTSFGAISELELKVRSFENEVTELKRVNRRFNSGVDEISREVETVRTALGRLTYIDTTRAHGKLTKELAGAKHFFAQPDSRKTATQVATTINDMVERIRKILADAISDNESGRKKAAEKAAVAARKAQPKSSRTYSSPSSSSKTSTSRSRSSSSDGGSSTTYIDNSSTSYGGGSSTPDFGGSSTPDYGGSSFGGGGGGDFGGSSFG